MKKLLENSEIADALGGKSLLDQLFPHVSHEIRCYWSTETFYDYIDELGVNKRPEPRLGFPKAAWIEIQQLRKHHEIKYPSTVKKDVWALI
jgi:hypothetical protein